VDKKKLIKQIKSESPTRKNVTFYLEEKIVSEFRKECDKNNIKLNETIEALFKDFIGQK